MATAKKTEDATTAANKAAEVIANEATDENDVPTVTFTVKIGRNQREMELTAVADIMDADAQVLIDIENKRFASALVALLGEMQFERLRNAGLRNRDVHEVIMPAWQDAVDLAGEN